MWKFVEWENDGKTLGPLFDSAPMSLISRSKDSPYDNRWYKRLARFMPRKHARTFRTVKAVRAERLQEISEADAVAEGIKSHFDGILTRYADYEFPGEFRLIGAQLSFKSLWQSIHGPGSVEQNPWVWVVEFEPTAPPLNHGEIVGYLA